MTAQLIPFDVADPQLAAFFDDAPVWSTRFGLDLLDRLRLRPGMRILDVACGTGFPLFALADICGPSCELVGLDVWRAALERAQQRRAYFGYGNVRLVRVDGVHYPFPDATFDLIVSNLGVNNFDDPDASVAEWARVIRPGGRFATTTNLSGHMRELHDIFRVLLAETGDPRYVERLDVNVMHRGTVESHRQRLERAGFEIDEVVEGAFTLRYLSGTALFGHPLVRYGFMTGWFNVTAGPDQARLMDSLEQRLNDYAQENDGLRLTIPTLYLAGVRRG